MQFLTSFFTETCNVTFERQRRIIFYIASVKVDTNWFFSCDREVATYHYFVFYDFPKTMQTDYLYSFLTCLRQCINLNHICRCIIISIAGNTTFAFFKKHVTIFRLKWRGPNIGLLQNSWCYVHRSQIRSYELCEKFSGKKTASTDDTMT